MTIEELYHIYQAHPEICIDSRRVPKGSLFFAIRGEQFDGNDYATAALDAGARWAVVDREELGSNPGHILVKDSLRALQDLARHHRRRFQIPVLAITGSNGKTTTKELVSAVLKSHYPLHFTKENFNNHIGVPLTLLAMKPGTEVAVIEMGANHQGEIAALCRIAEPTHGLITNVGKAHLEGFGGLEGVRKGKSELYRYLARHNGVAFVNKDEGHLEGLAAPVDKKIFYQQMSSPEEEGQLYTIALLADRPFVKAAFFNEQGSRLIILSNLIGRYNFNNLMTAIVIGKYFKVPDLKIKLALEEYVPVNNRSQILHLESNTYIMDAYNANPSSMILALDNFRQMEGENKVAILGEMLELGPYEASEHEQIGQYAFDQGFHKLVLVGQAFAGISKTLGVQYFPDTDTLKTWLDKCDFKSTQFLIKGSRGMRLERILQ